MQTRESTSGDDAHAARIVVIRGHATARYEMDASGISDNGARNQAGAAGADLRVRKDPAQPCESHGALTDGVGLSPADCAPPDFDETLRPSPQTDGER